MIEPAAYGAAVSFGPNTSNFRDVVALLLERDVPYITNVGRKGGSNVAAAVVNALIIKAGEAR